MLAAVIILLNDAGFDNHAVNWVVLPLVLVVIGYASNDNLFLNFKVSQPLFWFILFLFWAALSFIWSVNYHRTLVEFLHLAFFGLVLVIASNLNENNIFRLGRIIIIAGFFVALLGLSQYLLIDIIRIQGTFAYPNSFGIFLVMLFLLGWGYCLRKPGRFLFAICAVLLTTLYLTFSRGSFICLAVAFPLLFVGINRQGIRNALLKTLFCLAIAFILTQVILFSAPYLHTYLVGKVSSNIEMLHVLTERGSLIEWSGISRLAYWEAAFRIFLEKPFVGTGLGTFFLAHFTVFADNVWYSRFVHNHYLQTLAELGIIGLLLLIGFILATLRLAWVKIQKGSYPLFYPGVIAAIIAFLIHIGGDFSWSYPGVALIFILLVGTVSGLSENDKIVLNKIQKTILIIFISLVFMLSVWQLTAYQYYQRGINYDARQDYYRAVAVYDRVNSIYPINSMAFYFASHGYYRLARQQENTIFLEESIIRAKKAVALSPIDSILHNHLGRLYWESNLLEKAEFHLELGVQNAGYRLPIYIDLARFYIQQGRYSEAEKTIRRALELKDYAVGMHPSSHEWEKVEQQVEMLDNMLILTLQLQ